jgi:hypothetical protein
MKKKKKRDRDDDLPLTRRQKIEFAATIYGHLVDGSTEEEIIDELGVTAQHYQAAKQFLLTSKGEEEERMTPQQRYARYMIEQERNIADLNDLVGNLDYKKQYSAIVGAIRIRSEIAENVIKTGQTLGVVSKEPERRVVVGGISITDMSETDLRKGVLTAIGGLSQMIERYGTGANVRQLSPGPLHHGERLVETGAAPTLGNPSMVEASHDKKNRAKSGKRAAGRRRVRD